MQVKLHLHLIRGHAIRLLLVILEFTTREEQTEGMRQELDLHPGAATGNWPNKTRNGPCSGPVVCNGHFKSFSFS
jgi:hypothetical protein